MMEISSLTVYAVLTGAILVGFSLARFAFPQTIQSWLVAFPRNAWAGRILAGISIALVTRLLLTEQFDWVNAHRPLVLMAAPAAFLLICFFMDELLSVRAFGGLLLLFPFWILKAAFEHPSPGKIVMTLFAYLLVIIGMVLVWSPYLFHKFVKRASSGGHLGAVIGLTGSVLGAALIILGFIAY